jgi:hypothetical protein
LFPFLRPKRTITAEEAWQILGRYYNDEAYRFQCRYEWEIKDMFLDGYLSGLRGDQIAYKIYGRLKGDAE